MSGRAEQNLAVRRPAGARHRALAASGAASAPRSAGYSIGTWREEQGLIARRSNAGKPPAAEELAVVPVAAGVPADRYVQF